MCVCVLYALSERMNLFNRYLIFSLSISVSSPVSLNARSTLTLSVLKEQTSGYVCVCVGLQLSIKQFE